MKVYTYDLKDNNNNNKKFVFKNNSILPYYYKFLEKLSKNNSKYKNKI